MPDIPIQENNFKITLKQVAEWTEDGETKSQVISSVEVTMTLPQITALGIHFTGQV